MTRCYIALGSNLENPQQQLGKALQALADLAQCEFQQSSPVYRSTAVGPGDQPDYLNAVACLDTELQPLELLHALQSIEAQQGRVRGERWAARTLDLDLLLYGRESIDTDELQVPHPRMAQRDFVLRPLQDIAPDMVLPCGTPLASLLARCPDSNLRPTGDTSEPG